MIEVERTLLLAQLKPDTSQIANLDRQNITLMAQLKQLEPGRYQVLASSATQKALVGKIAELDVERTIALSRSTIDNPVIQAIDRQNVLLEARLKQLQPNRYQALASSAMQKALARKIGELDVERTIALSRLKIDNPVIQAIDRQSILLEARLKQLQPNGYQRLAFSATRSALQAKIAELQALYQQEDRRLVPSAPSQQTLKAQIDGLNRRLAEVPKN